MIVKDTMCYTRLIELMKQPGFVKSVQETTFKQPDLNGEGFNGYIETEVTFRVLDIGEFARTYNSIDMTAEIYHGYRRTLGL